MVDIINPSHYSFLLSQEIISMHHSRLSLPVEGFPVARTVKNLPAMQETWFYPCVGKIEKGNGNPLQYSCLENPTDREAWWATVCGIAKSQHNRVTNTSILLPVDKCWHKLLVAYLEYSLSLDEAHAGSREWQALTQEALRA